MSAVGQLSLQALGLGADAVGDRFWSKVAKGGPSDCWLWTASVGTKGYGRFRVGSKTDASACKLGAHRVAYELTHGPIKPGLLVLHRCDTPRCCNPAHLFLGTHIENMADMRAKGRRLGKSARGEAVKHSKLTAADVIEIRKKARFCSTASLARDYGIAESTTASVINRTTWAHVP